MNNRLLGKKGTLVERVVVILVRPENPENVGLVARNMKNTGFERLRIVGMDAIDSRAYSAAVHAREILVKAQFFQTVSQATEDLHVVFAATSKRRKNFVLLPLEEAVSRILQYPRATKIGLLFGCERTGLTSQEMRRANFAFAIPQASCQPSYNLSAAVLICLFFLFFREKAHEERRNAHQPLPRKEQEECIKHILKKLEEKGFIHRTNRLHMEERIYDLFGRLQMSAKDKKLLLALFSKGISPET
ncbi:MAG: RNA methyltransferase [Candidatus Aminicenantales bacterium]